MQDYRKSRIAYKDKEEHLNAFLDIEGKYDNTSLEYIIQTTRRSENHETSCRWKDSMFSGRLMHTTIMRETSAAHDGRLGLFFTY